MPWHICQSKQRISQDGIWSWKYASNNFNNKKCKSNCYKHIYFKLGLLIDLNLSFLFNNVWLFNNSTLWWLRQTFSNLNIPIFIIWVHTDYPITILFFIRTIITINEFLLILNQLFPISCFFDPGWYIVVWYFIVIYCYIYLIFNSQDHVIYCLPLFSLLWFCIMTEIIIILLFNYFLSVAVIVFRTLFPINSVFWTFTLDFKIIWWFSQGHFLNLIFF